MLFSKKEKIAKYTVLFPHKQGAYAETYRVKDENETILFLKLINFSLLNDCQFTADKKVIEIEVAKILSHKNLCGFVDAGTLIYDEQKYLYIVTNFISGETVSEKVAREETLTVYEAKTIVKAVLNALVYIHSLKVPVIHNEITPQNVMLDMNRKLSDAKLIDFGHARFINMPISKDDICNINPFYMAPERFSGVCSIQTDLYSVGVMLYHLIFGILPWFIDLSKFKQQEQIPAILERRCTPLMIPNINIFDLDENLVNVMAKAMAFDVKDRFQDAEEFLLGIDGEIEVKAPELKIAKENAGKKAKIMGNGFADVAGMTDLKERLQSEVIDLLHNPSRAKELGLNIPNGLLFYGPPGCGKTFFAERFAEEIGCNYIYVLCSDIASPFIHGGQEKIANLFAEARKNAPTILFLDEVEAMIMDRNKHNNVSEQGEVNEFLGQLNNCGEEGVMVVAATNKPTIIDPAALRAGRLELKYYIPQPDKETRKELFRIGLRNRNTELGINYERLAEMTENRVSSDIKLIIDTAARYVFKHKIEKINQKVLENAILEVSPTVSVEELLSCEKIRDKFSGIKITRTKVGFIN